MYRILIRAVGAAMLNRSITMEISSDPRAPREALVLLFISWSVDLVAQIAVKTTSSSDKFGQMADILAAIMEVSSSILVFAAGSFALYVVGTKGFHSSARLPSIVASLGYASVPIVIAGTVTETLGPVFSLEVQYVAFAASLAFIPWSIALSYNAAKDTLGLVRSDTIVALVCSYIFTAILITPVLCLGQTIFAAISSFVP